MPHATPPKPTRACALPNSDAPRAVMFLLALVASLTACGGEREAAASGPDEADAATHSAPDAAPEADTGAAAGAPTWHADVQPILADRCGACHKPGGIAPFSVDSPKAVRGHELALLDAVETGRMPPWPPDAACRTYQDERRVAPAELEVLRRWVQAGSPEGDPADARVAAQPLVASLGEPDFLGLPEAAYPPNREVDDDYRCFVLDPGLETDRWIRAVDFRPDNESVVHHIVLFAINPVDRPTVLARDAAEDGPGYGCFGGPGLPGGNSLNTIAAWAPGAQAMVFPEDAGIRLRAGAVVVMQVHYNLHSFNGRRDRSGTALHFHDTKPEQEVYMNPMGNFALRIPAGAQDHVQVLEAPNTTGAGLTLLGVTPHMHALGRQIRVEVVRPGGDAECLADIPAWDFHWQGTYMFKPGESVRVGPEDSLRLTCRYDNDAPDARLVSWGEGTGDEMCLAYFTALRDEPLPEAPPAPPLPLEEGTTCQGLGDCIAACSDVGCDLACQRAESPACQQCYITGTFACGTAVCPEETADITGCAAGCLFAGAGADTCPVANCLSEYIAFTRCLGPHRAAGTCNDTLDRCGVAF